MQWMQARSDLRLNAETLPRIAGIGAQVEAKARTVNWPLSILLTALFTVAFLWY